MSKMGFWVKQHSPEILLVSGIVNTGASVVLACFATKYAPKITGPCKKQVKKIHKEMDEGIRNEKQGRALLNKTYLKTGLKLVKVYAPAFIAFSLGVASMVGSHSIMRGRNVALASALATSKAAYDGYRLRVKEKFGEDVEREIYENRSSTKDEKKKETTEQVTSEHQVIDNTSDFSVWFGPGNSGYEHTNPALNISYLLSREHYLNEKLRAKKYLFLEEVYEELGYDATMLGERKMQAAHVLGWIYDPEDKTRDSYISFGLHDKDGSLTKEAMRMQQGLEEFILLDFNVDDEEIFSGDNGRKTFMKAAMKKEHY